jgi:hypothetical protein
MEVSYSSAKQARPMSDASNSQPATGPRKRGEAAWKAHRDAIASRNDRASRLARARRQEEYERHLARERAAERRERAELAKRYR